MTKIIGLTGGIGSGKSTVAELFAALGTVVVDTDVIAHGLTSAGGRAMADIEAAFGTSVIASDGSLDRAAMRRLVFNDPDVRRRLEAILHPVIRAECDRYIEAARAVEVPYLLLVVPLLIESGDYRRRIDRLVVVDCDDETRVRRVMARSGLEREDVLRIMAAQAGRNERLTAADDIIDNSGDADKLAPQVARLHREYLELAAARG